jgi:serine/threonine-protein kinase HipA
VSADTGPEATVEALMSVIAYFRLSLSRAKEILREVERAVAGWRKVGRTLGMSTRDTENFADAFEHSERTEAKKRSA